VSRAAPSALRGILI